MRIFPNPTNSDGITIQTMVNGEKQVKLYDVNGRLVLNKNLNVFLLTLCL